MNPLKISYGNFVEYNAAVAEELQQASESFVRIGYLLKLARDTDVLHGSGYEDVSAYAEGEYHLDKTQVSRFIRINDKFSEGGNSAQLKAEFRGMGYAKLSLMLLIPDALNAELTPAFSKAEITVLKEEVQEEQSVTPIERILEGEKPELETMTLLEKVIWELLRVNQYLYAKLWKQLRDDATTLEKDIQGVLAPGGEQIYSVRVQGLGRIALSLKGTEKDVVLVNIRTEEKEIWGWHYLVEAVRSCMRDADTAAGSYEQVFGEPWENLEVEAGESTKVAPVQTRKTEKVKKAERDCGKAERDGRKAERKGGKEVIPAKKREAEAIQKQVIQQPPESASLPERVNAEEIPQCDGQTDFQDFPEILPQEIIPTEEDSRIGAEKWDEALPCPFCGGETVVIEGYRHESRLRWRVWCVQCMAGIYPDTDLPEQEVKERWNRRVKK